MVVFIEAQEQKELSMKVILMMCFNQSLLLLKQAYNNI